MEITSYLMPMSEYVSLTSLRDQIRVILGLWAAERGPPKGPPKRSLIPALQVEEEISIVSQVSSGGEPNSPVVGLIMGSQSDWETMKLAAEILQQFEVPHESRIVSAHRTPQWMVEYATTAAERGLSVIIAGAGGAAHLPGMVASLTRLPVLGVPVQSKSLSGWDSLLSIVQMPAGVPVGTLAIGTAGAKNAALLAIRILGLQQAELASRMEQYMQSQTQSVLDNSSPDQ